MYLLDTNHFSFIFIQKYPDVIRHFTNLSKTDSVSINTIVYSELIYMALKSKDKDKNLPIVEDLLKNIYVHPIDKITARIYGEFSTEIFNKFAPKDNKLRRKFKIQDAGIGINDLWIACTAIQHKLIIVTQDKDFNQMSQVRPLSIECWKSKTTS